VTPLLWLLCVCAAGVPRAPAAATTSSQVVTQLKSQFVAIDADHNEFLDKDELAHAFRGPKAKPPAQGMYDDQGHLTKVYYEAKTKYPDLVFLWSADKDADGFVSWAEFRDYELKLLAAQRQMQQAWQRGLQSMYRRTATRSRRSSYGRPHRYAYRGHHSSAYSQASRQAHFMQHSYAAQQRQMMNAVRTWQSNQSRAQAAYRQAYEEAVRRQVQAQQRMVSYVRQQQTAYYRMLQRHANAAYQAPRRRR